MLARPLPVKRWKDSGQDRRHFSLLLLLFTLCTPARNEEACHNKYNDCFCEESYCYYKVEQNKTFIDAEQYCRVQGGHLATARSAVVQDRIHNLTAGRRVLIGAREHVLQEWTWLDGSPYDGSYLGKIKPSTNDELAGSMFRKRGEWSIESNSYFEKYGFVCEKVGHASECKTDKKGFLSSMVDGRCLIYSFGMNIASWFQAREHCLGLGADLIKFETQGFFDNVAQKAGFGFIPPNNRWLGMRKSIWKWESNQKELLKWYWSDDSYGREPNHCVIIDGGSPVYKSWLPSNCGESHSFVCEIQKGLLISTSVTDATGTGAGTDGLSQVSIVGTAVGVVVPVAVIIVITVIVIYIIRRKRADKSQDKSLKQTHESVQYSEINENNLQDSYEGLNSNTLATYAYASPTTTDPNAKNTTQTNAYSYATPRVRMAPLDINSSTAHAYAYTASVPINRDHAVETYHDAQNDHQVPGESREGNERNGDQGEKFRDLYAQPMKGRKSKGVKTKGSNQNVGSIKSYVEFEENETYG